MRERLMCYNANEVAVRITPACAGKTYYVPWPSPSSWDHPRMCGKDSSWLSSDCCTLGSPPHVRERRPWRVCRPRRSGITPACAGKTDGFEAKYYQKEDHPRMCGKDARRISGMGPHMGSPPHVRERRAEKHANA